MATPSVTKQGNEFFRVNGNYLIDPESKPDDLLVDALCFLEGAAEIVSDAAEDVGGARGRTLWGALYLIEMALGASRAASSRFNEVATVVRS